MVEFLIAFMIFSQTECDDNLECTIDYIENGSCKHTLIESYCLIENRCYKTYEVSEDGCGICLPQKDQYNFSDNRNDDLVCTIDVVDEQGRCLHILNKGYCLIDHMCVLDKTEDINGCRVCDTSKDLYNWTPYESTVPCNDGNNCTMNDHCDGIGECRGVPYSCDDGIECTLDLCDGNGGCKNPIKNDYCYINGRCIKDTEVDPSNECRYCNVLLDQSDWTYAVNGTRCNDGDESTSFDYCNGKGSCIGYKVDPFLDAGVISDAASDITNVDTDIGEEIKIEREGCSCSTVE
jgi:hypothetical protein